MQNAYLSQINIKTVIQHHQTKHGQKEKNGGENPKHAYLKDYKNLVTQNPDDPKINNIATKISLWIYGMFAKLLLYSTAKVNTYSSLLQMNTT